MANLYTKTGDKGETGLVGGSRVRKDSARVNCYGTMDEVNAVLGVAYALTHNDYIKECIDRIQHTLFRVGAELASDEKGLELLGDDVVCDKEVTELEGMVDRCTLTTG
ncbi:ATP:cob(I)alamin adenosyltransferase, partial [Emergencia timonensis]